MISTWESFLPKLVIFGLIALGLLLIGVVGAFDSWIGFLLFLLAILLAVIALVGSAAFWIVRGIARALRGTASNDLAIVDLAGAALLIATVLLVLPLIWFGRYLGELVRLAE